MVVRKEAKNKLRHITNVLFHLWTAPFGQIEDYSNPKESQGKLIRFEVAFVDFVEFLASVQRYGPTSSSERKYQMQKMSLVESYKDLRPFLLAFLRYDVEDERIGLRFLGFGTDAFEATWAAPSLNDFLENHDVFFTDRVGRTSEALKYYNDHLHCLGEAA